MAKAKPFIKWVGGKGQLLEQLDSFLPNDIDRWEGATYIEPFVGGGAMLFYMLQHYPNIKHAFINDINKDLITCYCTVRDSAERLIASLKEIEEQYLSFDNEDDRKSFYLGIREKYNTKKLNAIDNTTFFIFLNRTCFNGLYRVNKSGAFNVPFGRYINPKICDAETIREDSKLLQRVTVMNSDFENTFQVASSHTLFYFDPPYRPLSNTSSFNDYTKESFNDDSQIRLKKFCDRIDEAGFHFMLSNSDCKDKNENDNFFDVLYADYPIERVWASRSVNAIASKRGKLTEILVHNYCDTKATAIVEKPLSFSLCIS